MATAALAPRKFTPPLSAPVVVNGRFRVHKTTGLQRYANELASRLSDRMHVIEPESKLRGPVGHAWEQLALPLAAKRNLLWSPCNTGPVAQRHQVVTIHDLFPLEYPEWFSPAFCRAFRLIVPALTRRARHIIAVSEYTRQRLIDTIGIEESKITVVHSGVGSQFALASRVEITDARNFIGLNAGRYVLSVSSLEPRKNVGTILQAWEQALPHLPADLHLVLAGGAASSTVFHSLNLKNVPDRVLFPGYVPDFLLKGLYSGAHAFVFPSLAEGFGFPALEAMACGTPVITSNNSSLKEVTGSSAILVNPNDASEIARGIVDLTSDTAIHRYFSDRGLSRAKAFSWDRCAEQTWSVLDRVLTNHGSCK